MNALKSLQEGAFFQSAYKMKAAGLLVASAVALSTADPAAAQAGSRVLTPQNCANAGAQIAGQVGNAVRYGMGNPYGAPSIGGTIAGAVLSSLAPMAGARVGEVACSQEAPAAARVAHADTQPGALLPLSIEEIRALDRAVEKTLATEREWVRALNSRELNPQEEARRRREFEQSRDHLAEVIYIGEVQHGRDVSAFKPVAIAMKRIPTEHGVTLRMIEAAERNLAQALQQSTMAPRPTAGEADDIYQPRTPGKRS